MASQPIHVAEDQPLDDYWEADRHDWNLEKFGDRFRPAVFEELVFPTTQTDEFAMASGTLGNANDFNLSSLLMEEMPLSQASELDMTVNDSEWASLWG
jgi:hypothetical protein